LSDAAYSALTARILEALEQGTAPWRKPWHSTSGVPTNGLTRRQYRGINVLLLSLTRYRDHRWLTFRQALEIGGSVRRGERSTEVVFWKPVEARKPDDGEEGDPKKSFPVIRTYKVFNAEQCDGLRLAGIQLDVEQRHVDRIPRAEGVLRHMPDPPSVRMREGSAWYAPDADLVGIPPIDSFFSADSYYATLFHELGHATGHPRRLARPGLAETARFGSADYGREELVAELASAFVCAAVGLDNSLVEDSASYVAGWLKALRNDQKAAVVAAGQAQRAADWMLGKKPGLSG
jgi:antirestriction protein ArdC